METKFVTLKSPLETSGEEGQKEVPANALWIMGLMMDPSQLLYEAGEHKMNPHLLKLKAFDFMCSKEKTVTMPYGPRDV